ncbi:MAG: exodeoxyribonuclease VII small subunit [Sphingobacteriia bacterium]|nr:exodeoxyribonuclease VII small subunit [Sphingobacteriia bacterium]
MDHKFDFDGIDGLSFEEALTKLEAIVKNLENGKNSLDYLIKSYEYANELKRHCDTKLKEAKLKIELVSKNQENEEISEKIEIN